MKHIVALCLGLWSVTAIAAERVFTCDARDEMDRKYKFEFSVDSGVAKKQRGRAGHWEILNSNDTRCSHVVPSKTICQLFAMDNLNVAGRAFDTTSLEVVCDITQAPIHGEYNTVLQINRAGNGMGYFVCGDSKGHDLNLSNCKMKTK